MELKIRRKDNKDYVLCPWRRRWVRLTPEEWVRQHFLRRLVTDYGYPTSLIGVEVPIRVGDAPKRLDAVVMHDDMQPALIIEFKRETIALTQKVLDQASVYNRAMHVPYLILSNGPQTIVARVLDEGYEFLDTIPTWNQF